jgi:hypothetical protein
MYEEIAKELRRDLGKLVTALARKANRLESSDPVQTKAIRDEIERLLPRFRRTTKLSLRVSVPLW